MLFRKYVFILTLTASLAVFTAWASEFATEVLEYFPAPGQYVNDTAFNDPLKALGPPVGIDVGQSDNTSIVSLGSFGGRIVLKFDHTVIDDPRNPMGLDAIAFGNAFWKGPIVPNPYWRWQEPGHIEISRDVNGNGIADDTWYLVPGSHSQYAALSWTSIIYHETDPNYPPLPDYKDLYPSTELFPDYPRPSVSFLHILLPDEIVGDYENPNEGISDEETVWGYCDISPTVADPVGDGEIYLIPDNPYTVGLTAESGGGEPFDIANAIDVSTGEPACIDGFDFIRITSGSDYFYDAYPLFMEISTEVDAVSDVKMFDEIRAFWKLDENNSSQIDSSPYANDGIVNGAVFSSSGRPGGAYEFDGVDDHILVGEHFTLDMVDEITIDCWIKLSQLPSTKTETTKDSTIVAKGISDTETNMNYELLVNANDYLTFRFYDGDWTTLQSDYPFTADDIGTWNHAAVTCGRKSGYAKLFLDMNCVGMTTVTGVLPMNDRDLSIGARLKESQTENHFPGAIDELCIECVEKVSEAYQRYWSVDGDTDDDGLPDLWEMTHFGSLSPLGDDDPDEDDETNADEFSCGTDPNNPGSFFRITSIVLSAEGVEIDIITVKGWKYTIFCSDGIDEQDWRACGSIIGDGTTMTYIDDTAPTIEERYYRVVTE